MNQFILDLFGKLQSTFGIIILILVLLEWILLTVTKKMESHKEGFVNVISYLIEGIPYILFGKILIVGTMLYLYEYRLFTLGYDWYVWILGYVLYDFMFYFLHYVGHKVRFFWCIHGVHHTAEEMKMTVAVRGSFLIFLHMPHTVIWLPFLGFDPFMILIIEQIANLYLSLIHI